MPRPVQEGLTDHELVIMQVLWDESPLSVQEILDRLPKDPKPAYTSLLTAVRLLEKKKIIAHEKRGKAFTFFPVLKKEKYKLSALERVLKSVFRGDAFDLAVNLIEEKSITPAEAEKLRALLEKI